MLYNACIFQFHFLFFHKSKSIRVLLSMVFNSQFYYLHFSAERDPIDQRCMKLTMQLLLIQERTHIHVRSHFKFTSRSSQDTNVCIISLYPISLEWLFLTLIACAAHSVSQSIIGEQNRWLWLRKLRLLSLNAFRKKNLPKCCRWYGMYSWILIILLINHNFYLCQRDFLDAIQMVEAN